MCVSRKWMKTRNNDFSSARRHISKEWLTIRYPIPVATHVKVIEFARLAGIHYGQAYFFILEYVFDGKTPSELMNEIDQTWLDNKAQEEEERG